jgi:hypothetical protein
MARCEVYAELQAEVDKSLEKLRELTTLQLEVFRSNNYHSFMRMDKELEVVVGEKERTIGALKQHTREHNCQPTIDREFLVSK